jgi:hypothetical protein
MNIVLRTILWIAVIGLIITFALTAPDLPVTELTAALTWVISTARALDSFLPGVIPVLLSRATLVLGVLAALAVIENFKDGAAALGGRD